MKRRTVLRKQGMIPPSSQVEGTESPNLERHTTPHYRNPTIVNFFDGASNYLKPHRLVKIANVQERRLSYHPVAV